jgi:uncharacterized membrane protein YwzB
MRRVTVLVAVIMVVMPVAAQAMTVDQFLAKANALKAKGMMALLSPDIGVLKAEMADAVKALQAEKAARKAAGKPPRVCAPEGTKLTQDEMLGGLAALPPTQRAGNLKDGVSQVMRNRFPCR